MRIIIKNTNENVARIKIMGIGGSGSNTVDTMIDESIPAVEYITINLDTV